MGLYKAKPTLSELYAQDPTLFSEITLPTPLNAAYFRNLLLVECGPLETIYDNVATLKLVLTPWSKARSSAWTKIVSALTATYNPIHNYDRSDTESISVTTSGTVTA